MDVDQALNASNPLGRTQFLILAASVLMNIETAMVYVNHVFLAEVPPHHCAYNSSKYLLNESIPSYGPHLASCKEYVCTERTNETQPCSNGWVYYTEETGESIVSTWDLVCDKDFLPDLSQTFLLAGFGIGAIVGGFVADKYGRRRTILGALFFFNVFGLSVSATKSFTTFAVLRFLMGSTMMAFRITLNNLLLEFQTPQYRTTMGLIPNLTLTAGYIIMTGFAYYVRHWRYFSLLIMSPTVILMTFSCFIPESVRWIISQGEMEKAEATMQKVAQFNGAENFPNPVFLGTFPSEESKPHSHLIELKRHQVYSSGKGQFKGPRGIQMVFCLFKSPVLIVTLILSCLWVAGSLLIMGFSLSTGYFAGDPFLNFVIIAVVDFPGRVISLFAIRKVGNLKPLVIGLVGTGLMLMGVVVVPYVAAEGPTLDHVLLAFAVLGKFCVGIVFPPIHMLSGELFPTTMRNSGVAVVNFMGSIGSFSSPILLYLDKYFNGLAFIIMAVFAFLAATMSLYLPETQGIVQPQTPADVQALFNKRRSCRCGGRKQSSDENKATRQEQATLV